MICSTFHSLSSECGFVSVFNVVAKWNARKALKAFKELSFCFSSLWISWQYQEEEMRGIVIDWGILRQEDSVQGQCSHVALILITLHYTYFLWHQWNKVWFIFDGSSPHWNSIAFKAVAAATPEVIFITAIKTLNDFRCQRPFSGSGVW